MGEVRVRKLDDAVVEEFRDRARRLGTSVEAMVRAILTEEAQRPRIEMLLELQRHQECMRARSASLPANSSEAVRDERWRVASLDSTLGDA